jgi:hypothetical protein
MVRSARVAEERNGIERINANFVSLTRYIEEKAKPRREDAAGTAATTEEYGHSDCGLRNGEREDFWDETELIPPGDSA